MRDIVLKNVAKDYRTNEAYKSLRTNVEFSGADNKVIVMKERALWLWDWRGRWQKAASGCC